jgi:hypothetical protein
MQQLPTFRISSNYLQSAGDKPLFPITLTGHPEEGKSLPVQRILRDLQQHSMLCSIFQKAMLRVAARRRHVTKIPSAPFTLNSPFMG